MITSSEILKRLKIEEENQQTIAKAELTKNSAAKKLVQLAPESGSQFSEDEGDDTSCKLYRRRWSSYKRKRIWKMANMWPFQQMYLSRMYLKRCRPQWRFLLWQLFSWKLLTYQHEFPCFYLEKVLLNRVYNIQVMLFCHAFDLEMGFVENFQCCPIVPQLFKCIFWSCKPSKRRFTGCKMFYIMNILTLNTISSRLKGSQ